MRRLMRHALFVAAWLVMVAGAAQAAIDPATAQKLLADDGKQYDKFGFSASVDGNTAVIGAPGIYNENDGQEKTLGSVYVFTRSCSDCMWEQQQELTADDGHAGDGFGLDVSVSGNTIVVGAPFDADYNPDAGAAYVFTRSSNVWTQQQKLADTERRSLFGYSVAVEGDTLVIGVRQNSQHGLYAGAAYVYTRLSNGVWSDEPKKLMADESYTIQGREARFGQSVDIDGNTIVIGAYLYNDNNLSDSGAAYVFTRSSSLSKDWTKHKLAVNPAAPLHENDMFGRPVSVDGDTILIGAVGDQSGAAYVFVRAAEGAWSQQTKLTVDDGTGGDYFVYSLAVEGDTAVLGAPYNDTAYIFTRTGTDWTKEHELSEGTAGEYFGGGSGAGAMDGASLIITAPFDDDNGYYSGSAYIYSLRADHDGDGVANGSDACAFTELNAVVKPAEGCSIAQLCPCNSNWKNHGQYVSCTAKNAESFLAAGLITEAEKDAICSEAGQSACGRKK